VQTGSRKESALSVESPGTAGLTAGPTDRRERSERNRAAAMKRAVRCRRSRKLLLLFRRLPSLVLRWAESWKSQAMRSISIYGEMTRCCCRGQARRWMGGIGLFLGELLDRWLCT
jgi:hypothetical protein